MTSISLSIIFRNPFLLEYSRCFSNNCLFFSICCPKALSNRQDRKASLFSFFRTRCSPAPILTLGLKVSGQIFVGIPTPVMPPWLCLQFLCRHLVKMELFIHAGFKLQSKRYPIKFDLTMIVFSFLILWRVGSIFVVLFLNWG